jgi:hypothetical protein
MKNKYKATFVALFCAASITTLKASSGYDLIIGFTQSGGNTGGNDLLVDVGPVNPYPTQSGLSNGKTWNLSAALTAQNFNLKNVQWGVLGDAIYSDGQNPQTLWVTTAGSPPPTTLGNDSLFGNMDSAVNAIVQSDFGGGAPGYFPTPGQIAIVSNSGANANNSWNQQTATGTLGSQFLNLYANPNVTGTNALATLWQVPEGATSLATNKLGTFTLSNTGILTFNVIQSTPPTPRIVKITRIGNASTIFFTTTNGSFTYSLYFTNTLSGPISNWPVSPATVIGNGLTNSLTDTTTATNRFYYIGVH